MKQYEKLGKKKKETKKNQLKKMHWKAVKYKLNRKR